MDFYSGIMAGIINASIGHPFDTLKTRVQTKGYFNLKDVYAMSLYKGFAIPLCITPLASGVTFYTYHSLRDKNGSIVSGLLAGVPHSIISCPFDRMKIRSQTNYNNMSPLNDLLMQIRKKDVNYRGLYVTMLRDCLFLSTQFTVYENCKNVLFGKINEDVNYFLSGTMGSFISRTMFYPVDVMKTNVQKYDIGVYDVFKKVNVNGLYKGYYLSLTRAVMVNSASFFVFEKVREKIDNKRL